MTTLEILKKAKALELSSAPLTTERKNTAIMLCADALCENATEILAANAKDVENARGKISEVMIDRLRLDETRIAAMADGMRAVAQLPDPVGRVLEDIERADGLDIKKISVPMGVVAIIMRAARTLRPMRRRFALNRAIFAYYAAVKKRMAAPAR